MLHRWSLSLGLAVMIVSLAACGGIHRTRRDMASPSIPIMVEHVMTTDNLDLGMEKLSSLIVFLTDQMIASPENPDLLTGLAMCHAIQGLIVEDENPEYARRLYQKGKQYGFQALKTGRRFRNALERNEMKWTDVVRYIDRKRAPAAFWTGMNWAGGMFLAMDDSSPLADLPDVLALMNRCETIDERRFFGGVHLFYIAHGGIMPGFAGGGPERVEASLKKALSFTDNQFMLPYVYHARFYARPYGRRALFHSHLTRVLEFRTDRPELNLANAIARAKAEYLLKKEKEYFKYD